MPNKKNNKNYKRSTKSKQNTSKSTSRQSANNRQNYIDERNENISRVVTIIVFAVAIILFFIAVLKGDGAWTVVHNVYVGIFGIFSSILLPILVIVILLVSVFKEFENSKTIATMVECFILVILVSSFIHIVINNNGDTFKDTIVNAYSMAPQTFNGGFLGGVIGWLFLTFGKAPAIIVDLVLIFVDIMFMTRTTISELFRHAAKPAVDAYSHIEEKREKKNNIDIPLDENPPKDVANTNKVNTKRQTRKQSTTSVEDNKSSIEPSEFIATDKIIEEINKSNPKYSKDDIIDNQDNDKNKDEKNGSEAFVVTDEQMQSSVSSYKLPPVNLLKDVKHSSEKDVSSELKRNAEKLIETLQSFNVDATVTDISRGPAVTRYELKPAAGIRISKITGLADDIALSLAARQVRIEAPIPGKSAVGIEIPNSTKNSVSIKEMIDTPEFYSQKSKLSAGLGKDITGHPVYCDIVKMPHLLIAGTTGSGKSVCMNSIIVSILYRATPDEVKFVMIDPKQVEFSKYAGIPHLLVPVVTNPKKAAGALSWAVNEMLDRYNKFSEVNVKDIDSYNKYVSKHDELDPMPKICIFIDELADLMMAAPKDVEDSICRLAQMARAAGMHLIIATQRPSVDVITGLVKANISSRIALTVSQQVDSRTILDMGGAEKLLGMGDMLYRPIDADKPYRVQGCYVSDEEIESICEFIKSEGQTQYDEEIEKEIIEKTEQQDKGSDKDDDIGSGNNYDVLFQKAAEIVIENGSASTSLLQRRLSVGYARGAKIIDQLEEFGVIGKADGSKPRSVLMTKSMLLEKLAYNGANHTKEQYEAEQEKFED